VIGYWHRRKVVLLIVSGITAAALLAVMVRLDRPLKTEVAPRGIVSFELAGSYENAHRILASWGENGHRHAALSLRVDYAFLIAYALLLYLLCAGVASSWPERCPYIRRMGFLLAGGQWVAALLDIIENILLQQILNGSTAAHLPLVARWCALVKFTLVAGGGLYIFWAGGMRVVCHWRSPHGRRDH
jgi:hypothetical protein